MRKPETGLGCKIKKDIETQGWSTIKTKKYNQYPYHKPFGTPSGKVEIYAFQSFKNEAYEKAIAPISGYIPSPAFTAPKQNSNEFILASGKNCVTCSGLNMFTQPTRYLGDRTVWMNPVDAQRLGIKNGDMPKLKVSILTMSAKQELPSPIRLYRVQFLPSVSPEATELSTL